MRKIIYGVGISLDGYIARPDGGVDFLVVDPEYKYGEFFKTVDVALMGRKTWEVAVKMGGNMGGMKTFIFSRTVSPGERDGVEFTDKPPVDLVEQLRSKPGKDIWLMGGGELARDFLAAGLVDVIHLGVVPVLIGAGIPAFPGEFPERKYRLVSERAYKTTGLVELLYERLS